MKRIYAAHINEDQCIQSIQDHLLGAAHRSKAFGDKFDCGAISYLCALLHDIGKYSDKFQKRIYEGGNPVDHSTAGAVVVQKAIQGIGLLIAYCIAGHHGGLPDGGSPVDTSDEPTLYGRLSKRLEPYDQFHEEINYRANLSDLMLTIRPMGKIGFSLSFLVRMLFSCLTDADYLDTEAFMLGTQHRGEHVGIDQLADRLNIYIQTLKYPEKAINKKRNEILEDCIQKSQWKKGLYTLTVPTGGGKTLSSLAFALKHAQKHTMDRVIYVIPYNSIIEQNAGVFKHILGESNVLEHHSNISYDEEDMIKYRLASENWDMPIVVTTTVQFFESFFANKSSKCRKLHNIANSVVIFDESQMLPTQYLLPCIRTISELVYNYGSTAVLCSATQPALTEFFPKELQSIEICENKESLAAFFKGTQITPVGKLDDAVIIERLNAETQVLCIVNTRKHAQKLFRGLDKEGSYHLSTLMYPIHRKRVLAEIRDRLYQGIPCRVVSTSLIEAGVDIDFPVVYRAEAGLDSIIQAAGRCNRERSRPQGPVYVFSTSEEHRTSLPAMLKRPAAIAGSIAAQFEDVSSLEAISAYFSQLYHSEGGGLDSKNIVDAFEKGYERGCSFPFTKTATEFKLIDNATYSIIIPDGDEIKQYVEKLKSGERTRALMRKIQPYSINVYEGNYCALYGAGIIVPLDDQIAVLTDMNKYHPQMGLEAMTDSGIGVFL